jgi:phage tail sheath protein FI
VPPAGWAASVAANLPPSTSIAWKSSKVSSMLSRIVRLEATRGQAKSELETAGINTIIQKRNGGFAFESAVVTNAPNDPSTELLTRTRMAHYIGRSERDSLQEFVDSPNVALNQQDEVNAIQAFLSGLKRAASTDPNNLPHIVDFTIDDIKAFNPQASMDAGDFTIPQSIKTSSGQKRIFLSLNIGPSVSVNVQL